MCKKDFTPKRTLVKNHNPKKVINHLRKNFFS